MVDGHQQVKVAAKPPTANEKALIIATCTAGIMGGYDSWRAFESEAKENQSFQDWAIDRGTLMAREIFERVT